MTARIAAIIFAVAMSFLAVGTMAACTSATAGAPPITTLTSAGATSVSTSAPQPTTTAAPATSGAPTPGVLSRTYADNGGSVTLHVGGRLDVSLAGQWTFQPVSAPAVLHAGTPSVSAEPNCRPGMGCAIVTEEFTAAGAGTATIVATRTSCGEAMRCTSANDHFRLTVTVV